MYGTLGQKDGGGGEAAPAAEQRAANQHHHHHQTSHTRQQNGLARATQDNGNGNGKARQKKRKIFSHCHMASDESGEHETAANHAGGNDLSGVDKSARRRLIVASVICLLFMIGEVVGGVLSGSLAIATDAAHLLTDFASFMISLFAIWLASRPASRKMSFGWYRAEVIGALLSVLMIWLVTGLLVYMAIERLRTGDFEIDATVMVITAGAGLLVNIIMAIALNVDGHGHSHGHFHAHSHAHSHERDIRNHSHMAHVHEDEDEHDHEHEHEADGESLEDDEAEVVAADLKPIVGVKTPNGLSRAPKATAKRRQAGCNGKPAKQQLQQQQAGRGRSNINVRAAFIHVIGDFLQSLGVLIAALVIYFEPAYAIVDPICTFLFSIIVLVTTINIIRDATNVLMEGIPDGINFIEVREQLQTLPGVVRVHNLRIWSLSLDKIAISTHLVIDPNLISSAQALKKAIETLKSGYSFFEVTIQIEEYREDMKDCEQCQDDDDDDVVINMSDHHSQTSGGDSAAAAAAAATLRPLNHDDGSPA